MNIARIDRATLTVVNTEVADDDWLQSNSDDPTYLFVPYTADSPAWIGSSWSETDGFEQPPAAPGEPTAEAS